MSSNKLRVAICGGGVGGLSLALVLQKFAKKEIQIDIYEAKDKFAEIGAGLTVWKRTWDVLQALGLDKAMCEMAGDSPVEQTTPSFAFRRSDQPERGLDFYQVIAPFGAVNIHRADVLKVLTDSLSEEVATHFSKQLVGYSQDSSGAISLAFADGTLAHADVLVGADGLKSITREVMYRNFANQTNGADAAKAQALEEFIQPTWSGMYAYRTLIDSEKLLKIAPDHSAPTKAVIHFGKNKHVVSYPLCKGRFVNFVSLVTDLAKEGSRLEGPTMTQATVEELVSHHEGWETHIQQLLSCVQQCSRWAVCQNRDLPFFVSGHIALLGDAAHAMTPSLGAGAGQAIEDAYILGRLLSDDSINAQNADVALRTYETVRKPVVTNAADRARTCGYCYDFNYAPDGLRESDVDVSSVEGLKSLADVVYSAWSFNWTGSPEDEWSQASIMLKGIS